MKKLVMILALIGTLSLISVASAQFNSSQSWGSFGNGTGQFYGMTGVAADISGNIYVAELDNRVQKFNDGSYITQFNIPARCIAIDSSGNIYATVDNSIKKFSSTGNTLNTWGSTGTGNGQFNFPTGIALDSSGNIYISDTENNRIQKLDSSGNYVKSWGTLGSGNGNLNSSAGIAVSGNYVYVADMGNYRIQKFDLNGNYVSSLGSKGTGNTQFSSCIAVANDSSGNIYVADYYNGRVLEYDSNFNYLTQYTGLSYPTALVVANNNLYVLDSGNYRVIVFTNNPGPVANFAANVTSGTAPLSVKFNDTSTGSPSSWNWNFGDGQTSTAQNPSHTYSTAGTYTVSLNVSNANGSNILTKSNLITVNQTTPPSTPWVTDGLVVYYDGSLSGNSLRDLSGNNNIGYATSVIQGTNSTTGTKYINFNGVNSKVDVSNNAQTNISSPISIEFIGSINEFKQYATVVSKYYNWATGWYLSSSRDSPYNHPRFAAVTSSGQKNYESDDSIVAGQVYDIIVTYDNSITRMYINGEETDERTWNSPAIVDSGNITIGYSSGATYGNISMYTFRLYNRSLNSTEVRQNYMSWTNKTPVARFTTDVTSGLAPLSVQFTDTSTGSPSSWNWNFGDGQTSTAQNPSHIYSTAGTYTVSLNVSNANGSNILTKSNLITVTNNPGPVANFTANPTSGDAPLAVKFNDTSTGSPSSWNWNFGDGQTSTAQNPSHTYSTAGTYTVSLNVSNAYGSNILTKSNLITVNPPPSPVRNGLIVYYDGSLSGNSLVDLSGNNNIGYATSITQGTNSTTGAKYINFNGVNSKVDVSNNAQTNISSPISIEFIGSINEFKQYATVVSKYYNWATGWYLSSSSASPYNHPRFAAVTSSGQKNYESDDSIVAGKVYDIVVTYDNSITRMYINGEETDDRTWNSPAIVNSGNITIGYRSGATYGNISMYTFRLYNKSLNSTEVRQNYNNDYWRYNANSTEATSTKATPTVTWSNPATITYGTALSETQLNAHATVPGSFVYSPASGTIPRAGTQTLQTTFTPTDTTNYTTATSSVPLTVNKATPLITWSNPASITNGTALSSTQLNAVAIDPVTGNTVAGRFTYTPAAGTVLSTGTHTLHVNFTPTDAANYIGATADVTINVLETTKAIPIITWSNPADIVYGTALSGTQLNAKSSVPGSFTYNPISGIILEAGIQTLQTTFTPDNSINYTTASSSVSLTIDKAVPSITWSNPADITYGTSLSETQLNASASVPGSLIYNPASGTVLSEGTHTLHVDFTPTNTVNYTNATADVTINVVNNAPVKSSSGNKKYSPVDQKILEPDKNQSLNSSEDIGNNIESDSGNKTINEDIGNKTELESGNKTIKGLQTKQKESHNIPGFEIYCGVACLLGLFLYNRQ